MPQISSFFLLGISITPNMITYISQISISPKRSCTGHRSDPILDQASAPPYPAPDIGPTQSWNRYWPIAILHQASAQPDPALVIGPDPALVIGPTRSYTRHWPDPILHEPSARSYASPGIISTPQHIPH